jgi:hypothetical protein
VETDSVELRSGPLPKFCAVCGKKLISACPSCGAPIRGGYPGVAGFPVQVDEFCGQCPNPFPWASRQTLVYYITNQLESEDLAEGDRRALEEQLQALLEPGGELESEQRQIRALEKLKAMAPGAWGAALPLIQSLATSAMKAHFGLT